MIGVESSEDFPQLPQAGEFVEQESHPPADLFDLSQYYYSFLKSWNPKCCSKLFSRLMTGSVVPLITSLVVFLQ